MPRDETAAAGTQGPTRPQSCCLVGTGHVGSIVAMHLVQPDAHMDWFMWHPEVADHEENVLESRTPGAGQLISIRYISPSLGGAAPGEPSGFLQPSPHDHAFPGADGMVRPSGSGRTVTKVRPLPERRWRVLLSTGETCDYDGLIAVDASVPNRVVVDPAWGLMTTMAEPRVGGTVPPGGLADALDLLVSDLTLFGLPGVDHPLRGEVTSPPPSDSDHAAWAAAYSVPASHTRHVHARTKGLSEGEIAMPPDPALGNRLGTSRSTSATIPPNILRSLVVVAIEDGVDLRPVLANVRLSGELMRSTTLRVSYGQGAAVIRRALELTGDDHLGLRVGAAQHPTSWGLLGFTLMACNTLEQAIDTGVKYQNLSGAMLAWSTNSEEDGLAIRVELPAPNLDPLVAGFLIQEAFGSAVALIRVALDQAFAPRRVEFSFPAPPDTSPFESLFHCPVSFGAADNRLVIDGAQARASMPGQDAVVRDSTLELLDEQLAARRYHQELLEVLEISIAQSLPTVPSFAEQARRHSASERTLRRRLAECGTTYEAVVDGARRERVEQLLRRTEATLRDIARQAGFSDSRALRRAVRRWHGMAPLELRKLFQQPDQTVPRD